MPGPKPLKGPKGPKGPNFQGPKGPNFQGPKGPSGPKPPSGPRPPRAPNPPRGGSVNTPKPTQLNTPKPTQQGGGIRDAMRWAQEQLRRVPGSQPAKPNPYAAKPTGRLTGPSSSGGRMQGGGGLVGSLLTGAQIGTQMRDTMPQSTFVSGRGAGSRATNNPRKNTPDPQLTPVSTKTEPPKVADTFTVAGVTYDSKTQQAINPDTGKISPNGYSIDQSSGKRTDGISAPTRDTPAPNGGDGSGTQTSPGSKMPILNAAGAAAFYQSVGIGGFMSNQLPGTTSSPDVQGNQEAVPFGGQETSVTKNTLGAFSATDGQAYPALDPRAFTTQMPEGLTSQFSQFGGMSLGNGADTFAPPSTAQGGKGYKEIKPTDPIAAEAFGEDWVKKNGGGSARLNAALNDTAGMQSYMSKFGSPEQDRMRAANMAFLNREGPGSSMLGLRAKEAVLGQIHAGGETYQLNSDRTELIQDKDGNAIAADRDAASAFKGGTMGAEEYRNSFKDAVKKTVAQVPETPATPKEAENPFTHTPAPATTAFRTDIPAGTFAPNSEKAAQLIDTVRQMDGTPPMSSQQISDSFLNKREPLMRDPRKK